MIETDVPVRRSGLRWLVALVAACACAPPDEPAAPAAPDTASAENATAADSGASRPVAFLGEARQAYSTPGFEHNPHADVSCGSCHSDVPGHGPHAGVECLRCHGGGTVGPVPSTAASRADCQACHHRADPPRDCARCHAPGELAGPLRVTVELDLAGMARTRDLRFPHARHGSLACTECHALPRVVPAPGCATCHAGHHRAEAECAACHTVPAGGVHQLSAHLGCGGAGCHTDGTVETLPLTRPVCLACHQDRADHERGRECGPCHLIREAAVPAAAGQRR